MTASTATTSARSRPCRRSTRSGSSTSGRSRNSLANAADRLPGGGRGPSVPPLPAAKRLTDRHTPLAGQEALADFLASGAYERHVRSIRRRNAVRRDALVAALTHHLGDVVTIAGAAAGLHLVVWLPGVAVAREATLAEAARAAGVGLYPVSPTAAAGSRRTGDAGFIIGYAGLDAGAIDRGVAALAAVLKGTLGRTMPPA